MKKFKKAGVVSSLILASTMVLSGCAPSSYNGDVYTGSQAKTAQSISYGTILSIREVKIKDESSIGKIIGVGGGGAIGGIAGSTIGGGKGKTLATVAGAIGGALLGNSIANAAGTERAYEIEVQQDKGPTFVVVQGITNRNDYYPSRRVAIINSGQGISISPR